MLKEWPYGIDTTKKGNIESGDRELHRHRRAGGLQGHRLQLTSKVSSATIRNELSDLVEMGYLEQPHTSAGRVPSPKGYRLYVNELMEQRALSLQETEQINRALRMKMQELDGVISKAGQMAAALVNYPAYAMAGVKSELAIQRFDLLWVDATSFIAVVMSEDNRVKSRLLHTDLRERGGGWRIWPPCSTISLPTSMPPR